MRVFFLILSLNFFLLDAFGKADDGTPNQPSSVFKPIAAKKAKTLAKNFTPKIRNIRLSAKNTIFLNDYVYPEITAKILITAQIYDSILPAGQPLYFVINSGGGSIQAGIEMINYLSSLKRPVHTITIWAASMAFHCVQRLGKRYLLKNSTLMIHKAIGKFAGEFPGQLDNRYERYIKRIDSLDQEVVNRTNGKYTLKSYHELVENEYWCDGENCIKDGFADEIVTAVCDGSMIGNRVESIARFTIPKYKDDSHDSKNKKEKRDDKEYSTLEVVEYYSACPLITGLIDWNVLIDGKPIYAPSSRMNIIPRRRLSIISQITDDPYLNYEIRKIIEDREKLLKQKHNMEIKTIL